MDVKETSSLKELLNTGIDFPGRWLNSHPWKCFKDADVLLRDTVHTGLGRAKIIAGLNLKGFFPIRLIL